MPTLKYRNFQDVSDTELQNVVKDSISYMDVCRRLGVSCPGRVYRKVRRKILNMKFGVDHFKPFDSASKRVYKERPLNQILVENSSYGHNANLKRRLIKSGLLKNICHECQLGDTWNGKKLTLQMDHINGISNDNRITNLRILCPNCHTQTDTYSSKNRKGG